MAFIEFEKSVKTSDWSMQELHSHSHYELYFLNEGTRSFFLSNALYHVSAPALIVIPPHTVHKTEGGPFMRFNINVSEAYLNDFQKDIFRKKALQFFTPNHSETQTFLSLLEEGCTLERHKKHADSIMQTLFSYFVLEFGKIKSSRQLPTTEAHNAIPPLVLKTMDYMNEHYAEKLTLDSLAENFFISKGTLLYNFKKYTNFSPIDFLLNIRLTNAKALLANSKKSVADIAEACGFSSANYFGLIFKKKEKISPATYRKLQRQKR
jgi:AraC-like DNA-binding protein